MILSREVVGGMLRPWRRPQNGECGRAGWLPCWVAAVAHFVYFWPKAESTSHSTGTGHPKQHSGSLNCPKPLE